MPLSDVNIKPTDYLQEISNGRRSLSKSSTVRYHYTIGGRTYQTSQILNNFTTATLNTRITRVYKVVQTESCGDLRDYSSQVLLHDEDFPLTDCVYENMSLQGSPGRSIVASRSTTASAYTPSRLDSPEGMHWILSADENSLVSDLKNQCRVVFDNSGTPLSEVMLQDQSMFFKALGDAATGERSSSYVNCLSNDLL